MAGLEIGRLMDATLSNILGDIGFATDTISAWFGDTWSAIEDGFCSVFAC